MTTGFRESLPLLVGSAGLFVTGVVTWAWHVSLGPTQFPLWALFLVLGFVAAIGAVLSWFFATGENPAARPDREAPEEAFEGEESPEPPVELGRPAPDVRTASSESEPPPWDEGTAAPPAPPPPPEPSPLPAPARPMARTRAEVEVAFAELEEIERDMLSRRRSAPPSG